MSMYIGIEAVGLRQCVAVASDSAGRIGYAVRRVGEPILLHSTDRVLLRKRLLDLLKDVVGGTGRSLDELSDATVCIGMAGAVFPSELDDLREEFSRLGVSVGKLICKPDIDTILVSHLAAVSGSVIVCNSGAAILVSVNGQQVRVGGWGPAIGENGSGYWLGRQTISAIAREQVISVRPSILWRAVESWLSSPPDSSYPDLQLMNIRWLQYSEAHTARRPSLDSRALFLAFINQTSVESHRAWRYFVSTLTVPLLSAAASGDQTAKGIVDNAPIHLLDEYRSACATCTSGIPAEPIVLYGGILNHNISIRSRLEGILSHEFGRKLEFITPQTAGTMRPVCGALLLALGDSTDDTLRLPSEDVIRNVRSSSNAYAQTSTSLTND